MKKAGLWIDHARAIVVFLGEDGSVSTRTLLSEVGKKVRSQGGARARTVYAHQDATYEARRDRRYEQHLGAFYGSVGACLDGADEIFLMGPGQAKDELRKHLETSGLSERRVRVETTDKLTEAQIVEKVKTHFGYPTRETF